MEDEWEQVQLAARLVAHTRQAVEALHEAEAGCSVVSGGGSGSCRLEAASGVFTEVQPGEPGL